MDGVELMLKLDALEARLVPLLVVVGLASTLAIPKAVRVLVGVMLALAVSDEIAVPSSSWRSLEPFSCSGLGNWLAILEPVEDSDLI